MTTSKKYTMFFNRSVFSQFHKVNFMIDDQQFSCCEQYMMYQKAILFNDKIIAEKILNENKPWKIKKLGRQVKNFDSKIWNKHRENVVRKGNYAKFSQNESLRKKLLETKGTTLVETNPNDLIWGIGFSSKDPEALDESKWRGQNLLGKILTKIRDEMLKDAIVDNSD